MGESIIKKIVGSKAGQAVLGSVAAGALGTVGVVMAERWVAQKLAERELKRAAAAAEKERQRLAAEAEKERQRLAAIAEQEQQRAAEKANKVSQRAAARAAKTQNRAARRAELESRVGGTLNRTFQRLGLNLRAEVSAAAPESPPAAATPPAKIK